ncbi:hypothetical protein ABZ172_29910, partial [Streptomyces sp. NPDC006296]
MGIFDRFKGRGQGGNQAPGHGQEHERSTGGGGAVPGPAPEASPGAGAGTAAGDPGRGRGWTGLPPIQRAMLTPARQTVASAEFAGSLTAWQNHSFSGTLSHAVLDDAPTGLIKDVASFALGSNPAAGATLSPVAPAPAAPARGEGDAAGDAPAARRAWQGPSVQRAVGPQVAPVRPRPAAAPAPLTRAATPSTVQRRVLPAVTPSRTAPAPATTAGTRAQATAPAPASPPAAPAPRPPLPAAPTGAAADRARRPDGDQDGPRGGSARVEPPGPRQPGPAGTPGGGGAGRAPPPGGGC